MSTDAGADRAVQKQREFMQLLPLTLAIAGLPNSEMGKYFTEGQMEARANAIRHAFRYARQVVIEAAK